MSEDEKNKRDLRNKTIDVTKPRTSTPQSNFDTSKPVRSLGIRTANLLNNKGDFQIDMFDMSFLKSEKLSKK